MHAVKRIGSIDDTGRLDKNNLRILNNLVYRIIFGIKPSAIMLRPKVTDGHVQDFSDPETNFLNYRIGTV
ncbi:MAG: hypothetical protein EBW37_12585 [Rhodobacteraceae bacterium]|nr:hypothetical protein [Paracoccaceae bacterium]